MEETKKTSRWNANKTMTVVMMGLLTAIVVVLQLVASQIKFGPFSITLCLAPIIIGAALFGWKSGVWLGFVFGLVVLLTGDASAFMAVNIPGTIITVLLKGSVAGLVGGLVYSLVSKKAENKIVPVIAAGIATPLANTGVFIIGCYVFFYKTLTEWGEAFGYENATSYIIFGMTGLNFLVELGVNLVLGSAIVFLIDLVRKMIPSLSK